MNKELQQQFAQYLEVFSDEGEELRGLGELLAGGGSAVDRDNFVGHVTGSGIVVHEGKMLLIFHNKLQMFLQPGGHWESGDESIIACASREVEEETGLKVELHSWHAQNGNIPINIDIHEIPVNLRKQETAHWHHDHLFLFVPTNPDNITLQAEEVSDYRWSPLNTPFHNRSLDTIAEKIAQIRIGF